ncbi:MAG: metalloregulator ArsR/SmtB family transcription factor, partial [Bacteroidota bacterium]|nr:metalloregulator ArsR/SmtB family transcription factor [Bacteroidota bacterium]
LLMRREELCVCDIERVLDMTQTKVSRHLGTLRNARLVTARREGRWMYYALRADDQFTEDLLALLRTRFAADARYLQDLHILDNNADLVCEIQTELR